MFEWKAFDETFNFTVNINLFDENYFYGKCWLPSPF
jgi:hypothetical protein